ESRERPVPVWYGALTRPRSTIFRGRSAVVSVALAPRKMTHGGAADGQTVLLLFDDERRQVDGPVAGRAQLRRARHVGADVHRPARRPGGRADKVANWPRSRGGPIRRRNRLLATPVGVEGELRPDR